MRIILLLLAAWIGLASPAWAYQIDTDERVVVFGDVHGAYAELVQLLQEAEVIDADANWRGGRTHLVSLGDLIDRGKYSRQVIELLMKLQAQAEQAGGRVHVVLGNHEVMVMTGDWRYISRAEYAAFADEETTAERSALMDAWRAGRAEQSEEELLTAFDKKFPPGFLGLQRAYAPGGDIGSWLLQQPLVIRINNNLYMHGGISTETAEKSLKQINQDNLKELRRYLELVESLREQGVLARHVDFWGRRVYLNTQAETAVAAEPNVRPAWFEEFIDLAELEGAFVFSEASPIWYRGNAYCHPYAEAFNTERLLKRSGASRVVVGHTPNPAGALERMQGQVLRLDTGMLRSYYRGRPALLIEEGGQSHIQYLGDPDKHSPIIEDRRMTPELWDMTDEEMEDLLLNAEIIAVEDIGTGITKPWRVTLKKEGGEEYAAFKYEDSQPRLQFAPRWNSRRYNESDRYQYDMAAYRLDRLIDLQMVPVSVERRVEDKDGLLSAWIPNSINERDRAEKQKRFESHCPQFEQYRLRFIFDILVHNEDRNLTNIIWTGDNLSLRFIDHSLAFRSYDKRPRQYRKVKLRLSDLLAQELEALTEEQLQEELGSWLHPVQVQAIIERRDRILKEAERADP